MIITTARSSLQAIHMATETVARQTATVAATYRVVSVRYSTTAPSFSSLVAVADVLPALGLPDVWNHSSTTVVHGQTFQEWFRDTYVFDYQGMSQMVSGFYFDVSVLSPGPPQRTRFHLCVCYDS